MCSNDPIDINITFNISWGFPSQEADSLHELNFRFGNVQSFHSCSRFCFTFCFAVNRSGLLFICGLVFRWFQRIILLFFLYRWFTVCAWSMLPLLTIHVLILVSVFIFVGVVGYKLRSDEIFLS